VGFAYRSSGTTAPSDALTSPNIAPQPRWRPSDDPYDRSSVRYWMASLRCRGSIFSAASRSAIVRAPLRVYQADWSDCRGNSSDPSDTMRRASDKLRRSDRWSDSDRNPETLPSFARRCHHLWKPSTPGQSGGERFSVQFERRQWAARGYHGATGLPEKDQLLYCSNRTSRTCPVIRIWEIGPTFFNQHASHYPLSRSRAELVCAENSPLAAYFGRFRDAC